MAGEHEHAGFSGGLLAGYNWQLASAWVAGLEIDWTWLGARGGIEGPWVEIANGQVDPVTTSVQMNPHWLATARGRIGFLIQPQIMAYATGGVAWSRIQHSARAGEAATLYKAETSFSETATGYVVGGGLEWALSRNWTIRAEYLFTQIDSSTSRTVYDNTGNFPATFPSRFNWDDLTIQSVRGAIAYKF